MADTEYETHTTRSSRCFLSPLIPILLESLSIIFLHNFKLFLTIYTLTTLPLSLLLTSLSLSSRTLKSHVSHLEWLVHVVPIWVEADNVRDESGADLRALLRLKALHAPPILVFSLLALVAAVSSAVAACGRNYRQTIRDAVGAVKVTWVRALLTCVVNNAALMGWGLAVDVLSSAAGYPSSVAVVVVGAVVEVYLMAVLSVAMVVSVAEERAGVDAVRVGSGLMKGRRVCGWVLSGLILLGSGCIGREMKGIVDGGDLGMGGELLYERTAGMRVGYMSGLVVLLGWVVLWSYVVVTVLYFDCRRTYPYVMVKEEPFDVDNDV